MISFDKVPVMDLEYINSMLPFCSQFSVWVQVSLGYQTKVSITKEQFLQILDETRPSPSIVPIWGQVSDSGESIEIGLASQWSDRLK